MNCKPRIFSHTFRKWSSRIRNFVASARCVCCANFSIFYESGHLESASLTLLLGAFASQMDSLENRSLQAQALSLLFSCSSAFSAFGQAFDRLVTVNLTHCCAYISALSTLYSARDLMSFWTGYLILRGASRLDAFSVYPDQTWLPGGAFGRQPVHQWSVQPGPLVLGSAPLKYPPPAPDRDRTVSRRSEPSSRTALMGEQPNPWDLLQPQDAMSRHRGAKPLRRCELLGVISLLSPG